MEKDLIKKAVISNRIYMTYDRDLLMELAKWLTYKLPPTKPGGKPEIIRSFTRVNDNIIAIPVGRIDLIPKDYVIIDKRSMGKNVTFPKMKPHITLRDSQQLAYDSVVDNWIINAKPGWGKTFASLAIASKFGVKTLVVTHTVRLRNQWVKEVQGMFDLRVPGLIGSGKYNINSPIVISNIQTLVKHIDKLKNEFGLVIIDECHHIPASTFKKVLDKLNARFKVGLSGTLQRKDRKHVLIRDYISDKIYIPAKENVMEPIILVYKSDIRIPGNHMVPWATRINQLNQSEAFRSLIQQFSEAQAERGHKVLTVGDRVEFLHDMADRSKNAVAITSQAEEQDAKMNEFINGEYDILYGSVGIFKEGISEKRISSLVLASVIANESLITQLIGRIIRKLEGKMQPEVIDIVLEGKTGENQFRTRMRAYQQEGYEVRFIN